MRDPRRRHAQTDIDTRRPLQGARGFVRLSSSRPAPLRYTAGGGGETKQLRRFPPTGGEGAEGAGDWEKKKPTSVKQNGRGRRGAQTLVSVGG